jgi:hypothetical protein
MVYKGKSIYKWVIWTYPHILGNLTYGMNLWEYTGFYGCLCEKNGIIVGLYWGYDILWHILDLSWDYHGETHQC